MLVIGAKGFAKEILHVINKIHTNSDITFFDDISKNDEGFFLSEFMILRTDESAIEYFQKKDKHFIIGVGNPHSRKMLHHKMKSLGGVPLTIISPTADIGIFDNSIGEGVVIMDNVLMETSNKIGEGTLVHAGSFISHDVNIGSFTEISPFVKLLGNVKIGDCCSIGTASVVLPGIQIGNNVIIGAGAVVTTNVPDNTTVVGVPAKPIIKKQIIK